MDDSDDTSQAAVSGVTRRWAAPSTGKERTAVQRAVDRLLVALAPDRVVSRATALPRPIERHRTRRGCILQAPTAAVSVSWFPAAGQDAAAGELHIAAWRGVVSHPGSARRVSGAAVMRELVLHPADRGAGAWAWHAPDGTRYDSEALVALCLALLATPASADTPAGHG
jgi:hypothetical protein